MAYLKNRLDFWPELILLVLLQLKAQEALAMVEAAAAPASSEAAAPPAESGQASPPLRTNRAPLRRLPAATVGQLRRPPDPVETEAQTRQPATERTDPPPSRPTRLSLAAASSELGLPASAPQASGRAALPAPLTTIQGGITSQAGLYRSTTPPPPPPRPLSWTAAVPAAASLEPEPEPEPEQDQESEAAPVATGPAASTTAPDSSSTAAESAQPNPTPEQSLTATELPVAALLAATLGNPTGTLPQARCIAPGASASGIAAEASDLLPLTIGEPLAAIETLLLPVSACGVPTFPALGTDAAGVMDAGSPAESGAIALRTDQELGWICVFSLCTQSSDPGNPAALPVLRFQSPGVLAAATPQHHSPASSLLSAAHQLGQAAVACWPAADQRAGTPDAAEGSNDSLQPSDLSPAAPGPCAPAPGAARRVLLLLPAELPHSPLSLQQPLDSQPLEQQLLQKQLLQQQPPDPQPADTADSHGGAIVTLPPAGSSLLIRWGSPAGGAFSAATSLSASAIANTMAGTRVTSAALAPAPPTAVCLVAVAPADGTTAVSPNQPIRVGILVIAGAGPGLAAQDPGDAAIQGGAVAFGGNLLPAATGSTMLQAAASGPARLHDGSGPIVCVAATAAAAPALEDACSVWIVAASGRPLLLGGGDRDGAEISIETDTIVLSVGSGPGWLRGFAGCSHETGDPVVFSEPIDAITRAAEAITAPSSPGGPAWENIATTSDLLPTAVFVDLTAWVASGARVFLAIDEAEAAGPIGADLPVAFGCSTNPVGIGVSAGSDLFP